MKSLRALVLGLALVVGATSCAAVVATLPKVISLVTDAALIVDQIDGFVHGVLKVNPNPDLEAKIDKALFIVRRSLAAANRTAAGSEKLSQEQVAAAFEDFRAAYAELLALTGPLGVTTAGSGERAAPGGLEVPEPLALKATLSQLEARSGVKLAGFCPHSCSPDTL